MSATDDIRVLLGEHGVKCEIHDTKKRKDTRWDFRETSHAMFSEFKDGVTVFVMSGALWTPEEAIAATVGRGTCYACETESMRCSCNDVQLYNGRWVTGLPLTVHVMECSECGGTYEHVNGSYEFCPRCGRRLVVDE